MWFPDLTQGAATINEKNLQVEDTNATLKDKAEIWGNLCFFCNICVINDNLFVTIGFEADKIYLLQSAVF